MAYLSRVVWAEGIYLAPHHFQVQSRYFEDCLHFAASLLWFQPYGLSRCTLNADALVNGTLSLTQARGIFSDGLPFDIPESDAPPPARAIADLFPPTREGVTVLLAVPERKPEGSNCSPSPDASTTRYLAESRAVRDESTGSDERPVQVGRKRVRLILDTEPREGLVSLPLARVVQDGSGHFAFDPNFVPPCLQISASERLMLLVRRLIEILDNKSEALSRPMDKSRFGDESSLRNIANFWLAHAVNSGLAPLRHLWTSKRGHPEEVFLELSRLAGVLCTFTLDSHPSTLPVYDHERLGECFDALDRHIRTHLEIVIPTNCVPIPLKQVAECFYEGEVTDTRALGRSRWVFGIHSPAGEAEVIAKTPQLVKICSSKFVAELVRRAMAGLELTHLPVPPPALPARVESQYFGISKSGPFWDHLVQTRRVGIYVPGELPEPELELFAILET